MLGLGERPSVSPLSHTESLTLLGWQVLILVCFIHPPAPRADRQVFGRWQRVQKIPVVSVFVAQMARHSYKTDSDLTNARRIRHHSHGDGWRHCWCREDEATDCLKTWDRQVDAAEVGLHPRSFALQHIKKLTVHLHKGSYIRKAFLWWGFS